MQHTETQTALREDYTLRFYTQVQNLTQKRKKLRIPQYEIARQTGCSIRKIQHFENYRSTDAFLLFAYKRILATP